MDAKTLLAAVAAEARLSRSILGSRAYLHYRRGGRCRLASISPKACGRSAGACSPSCASLATTSSPGTRKPWCACRTRPTTSAAFRPRPWPGSTTSSPGDPTTPACWENYPGRQAVPIHMTGNPRTDFLRPPLLGYYRAEAERLRARYDAFVLIDTNFSKFNPFVPALDEFLVLLDKPPTTDVRGLPQRLGQASKRTLRSLQGNAAGFGQGPPRPHNRGAASPFREPGALARHRGKSRQHRRASRGRGHPLADGGSGGDRQRLHDASRGGHSRHPCHFLSAHCIRAL